MVFRSAINGDLPIAIVMSEKLLTWADGSGMQLGARRRMLEASIPIVSRMWNPKAQGSVQIVTVDLDDNTELLDPAMPSNPCVDKGYSLWAVPGQPHIFICPKWIFCRDERNSQNSSLYGLPGCVLQLAHELGHVLGSQFHAEQNGRPRHTSGPPLCGWASDCIDPKLTDFTKEDEWGDNMKFRGICGDGGWNGRCGQRPMLGSAPMPMSRAYVIGD